MCLYKVFIVDHQNKDRGPYLGGDYLKEAIEAKNNDGLLGNE